MRLSEYIQLDIDDEIETTSTYVEDTSHIRQISVPKKYALMLKVYQDKGYAFKVVAISGSQVNIMVLKGGYAVFNIVSNAHNNDRKYDLWLEILLMHLSRHSEND
ncbi:MAG: hypothetical protein H6767_00355 [Candidatus Peribacteria bacterium]|nr:MAG: hypothetical protein H6767_00355 [Candidatus Peribacteria bacterium]